jgi:hypothetical protein
MSRVWPGPTLIAVNSALAMSFVKVVRLTIRVFIAVGIVTNLAVGSLVLMTVVSLSISAR